TWSRTPRRGYHAPFTPPLAKGVCHETFDVVRGDRRGARAPCRAGRLRSGSAAEQPAGKDDDLQCGCEGEGTDGRRAQGVHEELSLREGRGGHGGRQHERDRCLGLGRAEGGCTCRAVRFSLASTPLIVHCCHCRWCQRESGASFALNAVIEAERVRLLKGSPVLVMTPSASGKGQRIARCADCHIALWSH